MTRVRREYVDAAWGQVHVTRAGDAGPWVVLFHESPLSGEVWVPVLERLGSSARVVALDTPGYGASDPPDGRDHELVEYADVLAEAVQALGVERPVLCGSHTGASLAVEVAHRVPGVRGVALSGIPLYTDARHYSEAGIPTILYGAGPRDLLEANGHRADEKLVLEDLRRATQVVARSLAELLG